jgi:hypothetical protein
LGIILQTGAICFFENFDRKVYSLNITAQGTGAASFFFALPEARKKRYSGWPDSSIFIVSMINGFGRFC